MGHLGANALIHAKRSVHDKPSMGSGPPRLTAPIKYPAHLRPSARAPAQKGRYRISLGAASGSAGTMAPASTASRISRETVDRFRSSTPNRERSVELVISFRVT